MNRLRPIHLLSLLVFPLATGCGEDWQAQTFPATGILKINGEPAKGAVVQLQSTSGQVDVRNSRPWGVVKDDGSYVLSTYDDSTGVPRGDYAITFTWPVNSTIPFSPDRLGNRYAKAERSQWKVTIKEGENAIPPIELANVSFENARTLETTARSPMGAPAAKTKPSRPQR